VTAPTVISQWLAVPLRALETRPVWDTLAKEVVGINAPRIAVTRTQDERLDVAVSELGNTAGLVGAGVVTEQASHGLFRTLGQKANTSLNARHWETLGRSGAIYSVIFALMWAMPFVRNYITAKRTGQTAFADVITHRTAGQQTQDEADLQDKLSGYAKTIGAVMGLGGLAAAASWGGSLAAMRSGLALPKVGRWLVKNMALKRGRFSDFSGMKAVLFWGLPAYGGWLHASRDPYEKKEQLLKFFAFVVCFTAPQKLAQLAFAKKFAALPGIPAAFKATFSHISRLQDPALRAAATQLKVLQEGIGLLSSIILLGASPAAINIFLTRRRMEAAEHQNTALANAELSRQGFTPKSFERFTTPR
jgi:hypothetical protein